MEIPYLINLKDTSSDLFLIKKCIQDILQTEFNIQVDTDEIEVVKTQDPKFGDLTTNIALKVAKQIGKSPREIAEKFQTSYPNRHKHFKFQKNADIRVEIAGPGFLNFHLPNETFFQNLDSILKEKENYGKWQIGKGQVMVEFGQPNTHKAFHVGHLKSAITGLSLVKTIQNLGFRVLEANFFGDVGMHVAKTVWGYIEKTKDTEFAAKINNENDPHKRMKLLDECYVHGAKSFKENEESEKSIREINKSLYTKENDSINKIYERTREWSMEHLTEIFKRLGVNYDRQYPESEVSELGVSEVKKHIGDIFIEDQGAIILPNEKFGAGTWVFITKEGNPTYSGKDLGLALKKFEEYPELIFNLTSTSVEQNSYFKGVIKAVELTNPRFAGRYFHIGFGWMLRNGKKFSSRMGESIKGMDVISEANDLALQKISEDKKYDENNAKEIAEKVSVAGLKFLILSHEIHKDISYDPEEFLNPEGFSGPYVLYAYVRAKSILRQMPCHSHESGNPVAKQKSSQIGSWIPSQPGDDKDLTYNYNELNADESSLLKLLYQYPQVTLQAGRTLSPHLIAFYLFELAQAFNKFYKENKVLVEDENIRNFRLSLVEGVSIVLKNGLNLLGIETIEQM